MTNDGDAEQMLEERDGAEDVKAETSSGDGQGDVQTADQPNVRQAPIHEVAEIAQKQFDEMMLRGLSQLTGLSAEFLRAEFSANMAARLEDRDAVPIHDGNEVVLVDVNWNALPTLGRYAILRECQLGKDDEELVRAVNELQDGEECDEPQLFYFLFDLDIGIDQRGERETEDRIAEAEESEARVTLAFCEVLLGLTQFESWREVADHAYIAALESTLKNDQGVERTPLVDDRAGELYWDEDLKDTQSRALAIPTAVLWFPDELENDQEGAEGEAAETEGPVDANP